MDDDYFNNIIDGINRMNDMIINVQDAVVDDVFHDNSGSFVTISYVAHDETDMFYITQARLLIDDYTIIRDSEGRCINVSDLRNGSVVDASFSAIMTRSIPPQSRAYMISLVRENVNSFPNTYFPNLVQDRIAEIDLINNIILTGNPNDIMSQVRFVVSNMTEIFDCRGNRIGLKDLRLGQMIKVQHADFMTASIPPQTTALRIWVL